ncbi:LLM class flavin-dependent oxidoreductase [Dehalococcoidia bacterium]|nr:LLM class flavin-dependent oxidoreductase [Dehalococcoidia bacterium]
MDVGIYIRDYISDPSRPIYEQIEEAAAICQHAATLGFSAIYTPQHYIAYPTSWPQPMQMLARLSPEANGLKLITGVLLLPYHNPVDIAEQTATLDHISNGRFILGLGLGYREQELKAFGTNRKDRVSRFEESLTLMKQLWTGNEVTFEGKHWHVDKVRTGLTPVQIPHPPIWIAAQSAGAVRRAAAMGDACLIGPQPSWDDFHSLAIQYARALDDLEANSHGMLVANRSISIAVDKKTAINQAIVAGEAKAKMYSAFNMQESTTVDMGLSGSRELSDWAIVGNPQDCVDLIAGCHERDGLSYIGLNCLNLPQEHSARLEYLQMISEEFVHRLP